MTGLVKRLVAVAILAVLTVGITTTVYVDQAYAGRPTTGFRF